MTIPRSTRDPTPYAVLTNFGDLKEHNISQHVLQTLGDSYALGGVVSLEQIGLIEFPVNATHKVIKWKVQQAVIGFLDSKGRGEREDVWRRE